MEFPKVGDKVLIWETKKEYGDKLEVVYTHEYEDDFGKCANICTKYESGSLLVLRISLEDGNEYFYASDEPGRMYFQLEVIN